MKFITAAGILQKARRFASAGGQVQEDEVKSPQKLAEIIRQMQRRVAELEAVTPPEALEFELNVGSGGAITSVAHGINGAVRWYVVAWTQTGGATYPIAAPALVQDASSTSRVLQLRSYVAGKAIVRVEPAFGDVDPGITVPFANPMAALPNQMWSPTRSGASLGITNAAGNFTVGTRFHVGQPGVSCTGVRFYSPTAGKSVKVSLWNAAGTRLDSVTVTGAVGVNVASFSASTALTPHALYRVSMWQTDTVNYYPFPAANANPPARPFYAGGVVVLDNIALFLAGDAAPITTAAAEAYPVEPILV